MADINISTTVNSRSAIEDIEDAIEDGIKKGSGVLGQEMREVSEHRIRSVGAIFTGDLINSFDVTVKSRGNQMIVTLSNDSDHAAPIEYGAEYGTEGPPLAALIPWVEAKMAGFTVPEDDLQSLPSPGEIEEDTEVPEPDGTTTDLLTVVPDDTLQKAFWLQEHIRREGIDAVKFMSAAREYAERHGEDTIAGYIERELKL